MKVAVFASGTGTNALKLFEEQPKLSRIKLTLLIVDREDSPLPETVRKQFPNITVKVIPGQKDKTAHESQIVAELKAHQIEWAFLAGYMRILGPTLLNYFAGQNGSHRIVNIHPSLLPAFPGKDSYARAFEANVPYSGVTVHLVDSGVDTGPIVAQRSFARTKTDTLDTFAHKGKLIEWEIYPEILRKLDQEGTLMPTQNQVLIAIPTEGESRVTLFWLQYTGTELNATELQTLAPLITDQVDQKLWVNPTPQDWQKLQSPRIQIIHFLPGVTDNPAHSFCDLLTFHPLFNGRKITAHSGEAVCLATGAPAASFNKLIHHSFESNLEQLGQLPKQVFPVSKETPLKIEHFPLQGLSSEALVELSRKQFWALDSIEMKTIQDHYGARAPTDVEMEVLAQTWSEHCKHKIFGATIDYEDSTEKFQVNSLFKTYIEKPTTEFQKNKDWAISVFKDNAGIVRFHDDVDLCIKVETHNSPSALDPYGGALTGILGVNRDILGTGLGARPIANTNVLLFGEPTETHELPKGLLHPREILKGVHKGIQDGGNKSGIPTINGAILFDECFSGKPLVYCGTVGVLPREVAGRPSASKNQEPGDLIVMVGGAVGADGLHGATSSSLALDSTTPSGMVQIGAPLTQKRVMDFVLEARDLGLYSSITDNGAGGLSSSIGEMSEKTNGAKVWLEKVPLKYPGLKPWQIFVSESQERMTLAVPSNQIEKLTSLAQARGVDATVVGEFTASGKLEILYQDQLVGNISLAFLHGGLPKMKLKAKWNGPEKRTTWKKSPRVRKTLTTLTEALETLVTDPSIASKETWVRQYDHEVQAATAVKPFEGVAHSAPNDGGLVWMGAHGNRGFSGAAVSSGICPDFSLMDAGLMAKLAADEAVRNLIVMGVDPNKIALIDNFCWPDPLPGPKNPDAEHKLAQLVRTCRSLADLVRSYGMPLISGKDSMKNDFIGKFSDDREVKISVLPTLLVTAMGYHPDVRRALKAHALPGNILYLVGQAPGQNTEQYFGTTLEKYFEVESMQALNDWKLDTTRALYETFFQATESGLIESAHDLSEGGLLVALFETLILNQGGIKIDLSKCKNDWAFAFNENPGRMVVSVAPKNISAFEKTFSSHPVTKLGEINTQATIELVRQTGTELVSVQALEKLWKGVL